jgi:hypothetical protein
MTPVTGARTTAVKNAAMETTPMPIGSGVTVARVPMAYSVPSMSLAAAM